MAMTPDRTEDIRASERQAFEDACRVASEDGWSSFEEYRDELESICPILWGDRGRCEHAYTQHINERIKWRLLNEQWEAEEAAKNRRNARSHAGLFETTKGERG